MKYLMPLLVLVALAGAGSSQSNFEAALKIAEKNSSTMGRVQNLGCNTALVMADLVGPDRQSRQYAGAYYRSGSTEKFTNKKDDEHWVTYFVKDNVLKLLSSKTATTDLKKSLGRPIPRGEVYLSGALQKARQPISFMCDVYERALFRFCDPDYSVGNSNLRSVELKELLKHPKRKFEAVDKDSDGNDIVTLSVRDDKGAIFFQQFVICKKMNYLIISFIEYREKIAEENAILKKSLSDFVDIGEGLFFPRKLTTELIFKGTVTRTEEMVLENLEVNSRNVVDKLSFEFPKDIEVSDTVNNVVYQSGPDGSLKEIRKYTPPQYPPDAKNPSAPFVYPVSQESTFSWPFVLGGMSSVFLFFAAIIWARRVFGK